MRHGEGVCLKGLLHAPLGGSNGGAGSTRCRRLALPSALGCFPAIFRFAGSVKYFSNHARGMASALILTRHVRFVHQVIIFVRFLP
jgi:hypothetical protein